MALAARLPASILADLTGTSIASTEAWKNWSSRDWSDTSQPAILTLPAPSQPQR